MSVNATVDNIREFIDRSIAVPVTLNDAIEIVERAIENAQATLDGLLADLAREEGS